MQEWAEFLEMHPRPHLVVGWTRGGRLWRHNNLLQWIAAQRLFGEYSCKRDYEPKRGRYVILLVFEKKADAQKLAVALKAKEVSNYPGFASQREFRVGSDLLEKLSAALNRTKS
jgi:hypothetical protein